MSRILGYVTHRETGEKSPYYDIEQNGFNISPYTERWVSNSVWAEEGKLDPLTEREPLKVYRNEFESVIHDLCKELEDTLISKNRDYGSSVETTYDEFGDLSFIIRVTDKLERIKFLEKRENEVEESKADSWMDTAGYSILRNAIHRLKG